MSETFAVEMPSESFSDNASGIQAVEHGFSMALRYLKKTQRTSIRFLHEHYIRREEDDKVCLMKIGSEDNTSDVFTKELERASFLKHKDFLNVRKLDKSLALRSQSRPAGAVSYPPGLFEYQ